MNIARYSRKAPRTKVEPSQTRKFIAKREAVLDAAARQFNKHGLGGATLADVAGSVNLLTNSVTYYFRRKEDLAAACLMRAIQSIQNVAAAASAESTPEKRIRALVGGQADVLAEIASGKRDELVNFNDIRALRPPLVDEVFAAYTEMYRSVRHLFPDDGRFDRQSRNVRARLLLSLVNWMRRWISRFEPVDYPYAADRMADIVINGLAREPSPWEESAGPEFVSSSTTTDGEEVAEAFLRAATVLVNEQGYHGASIERISAELKLTKGSFYHHYASKDELIAACFERTFNVIRKAQTFAAEHAGSGLDRLSTTACALVRYQLSKQGPLVHSTAWNALPEAMRMDTQRRLDRLTERLGIFAVEGMIEGIILPLEPMIAAQQVAGMVNAASALDHWVPAITSSNAARLYVRPLFEGILSKDIPASQRSPPRAD